MPVREKIAAVATPPGRGAVGLVRLSGSGVLDAARTFLDLPRTLEPRRSILAWARDANARLDRVLAVYFPAGASYTGEETVEISAHGSAFILERLLLLAQEAGCRVAMPGEFTQRAFLNGRLDLAQAEAVCDLIAAKTARAHEAALAQLSGRLSKAVEELRSGILSIAAWVEADLDHPDEDIPLLDGPEAARRLEILLSRIDALCASFRRGRLAREGLRVAIVGRPNAGKSSLLNALLGGDRAIVSERPGTTRDTVEATAEIAGIETVLIDTAGLRPGAEDPLEREGQRRAKEALRGADLALCVLDRTLGKEEQEMLLDEILGVMARPAIAVLNKSDLPETRLGPEDIRKGLPAIEVSALTGLGIPALLEEIKAALGAAADPAGSPMVASARHHAALRAAGEEAASARTLLLGSAPPGELAAAHLKRALCALDSIPGRGVKTDVLDEIFSSFCIGK